MFIHATELNLTHPNLLCQFDFFRVDGLSYVIYIYIYIYIYIELGLDCVEVGEFFLTQVTQYIYV